MALNRVPGLHPWGPGRLRAGIVALLLPLLLGWPAAGHAGRDDAVVVKWLLELGDESRQKGKTAEALDYFRKALLLQPNHPEALRSVQELTRTDAPLPPTLPALPPEAELGGLPTPGGQRPAAAPPLQEGARSTPPATLPAPPERLFRQQSAPEELAAAFEPGFSPAQTAGRDASTGSPVPRTPAVPGPDPAARDKAIELAIVRLMQAPASSEAPMERRDMEALSRSPLPVMMPESGVQSIRVVINGRPAAWPPPAGVGDRDVLVPCRLVAESLGYTVTPLGPDHVEVVSARGDTWRLKLPGYDKSLTMPARELERCLPVTVRFDAPRRTLQISERKVPPKAFRTRYPTPVNASWDFLGLPGNSGDASSGARYDVRNE